MKIPTPTVLAASAAMLTATAAARANYVFAFSGTILSGVQTSDQTDLSGSSITLRMFINDLTDLTPSLSSGNYAIAALSVDIGSDGTIEQTISSGFSQFSSLFIDPGATQLVGASDIFGTTNTFVFGVNLPPDTFADVKDLAGQSNFSLSNLISSSFSFLNTEQYSLTELNLNAFGFTSVAVIPLPTPVAMAGLGLVIAGAVARRRLK